MEGEWYAILNPTSGGNRGRRDKTKLEAILKKYKFSYHLVETTQPGEAVVLVQQAVKAGYRKILGLGGDGTVNEIITGFMLQPYVAATDLTFGFIPVGTGNDWIRTLGIPRDYDSAAKALKTGNFFFQDIGKVETSSGVHFFANMCGLGYDGMVCEKTVRKKNKSKYAYLWTLLTCLFKYKTPQATVIADGEEIYSGPLFSMCIANGRFNGNGMMQAPDAIPDDQWFNLTLIQNPGKMQVIRNTGKLYKGTHIENPFVSTAMGRVIEITGAEPMPVECEGEPIGCTPAKITLLPRALKVIAPIRNSSDFH